MAFLKEKNAILRKTNYKLSKRQKTKNKRLQKKEILTIKEGQALLAEKKGGGK